MKKTIDVLLWRGVKPGLIFLGQRFRSLVPILREVAYALQNYNRDRPSELTIHKYSHHDAPYTDRFTDPENIPEQNWLRHIIAPIRQVMDSLEPDARIIEIGASSGALSNVLATQYPERQVCGIDFNPAKAVERFSETKNLRFFSGYAYDVLQRHKELIPGSLIVSVATGIVFTRPELENYMELYKAGGAKALYFVEPVFPTRGGGGRLCSWHEARQKLAGERRMLASSLCAHA